MTIADESWGLLQQIQPADTESTACFLSLILCKLVKLLYSPASLCLLRTADQEHAKKVGRGHIQIPSFQRDQRVRKEQEVKSTSVLQCLWLQRWLFSSLLGLSFSLSVSCYPGPRVSYSHFKLCFVKAGYCQCSVSRWKKYLQRVRLKWMPQPSRCNGLWLCFCKTRCQGSDMWKGTWLLKSNLVNKISGYHIPSWSYCSPKCLQVISQAPRNPEIGLNNMRLESGFGVHVVAFQYWSIKGSCGLETYFY